MNLNICKKFKEIKGLMLLMAALSHIKFPTKRAQASKVTELRRSEVAIGCRDECPTTSPVGFEPTTYSLGGCRSNQAELRAHHRYKNNL